MPDDGDGPEARDFWWMKDYRARREPPLGREPLSELTPEEHGLRLAQAGWRSPEIRELARGAQDSTAEEALEAFRSFEDWWLWKNRLRRPEGDSPESHAPAWGLLRAWASGEIAPEDEAAARARLRDSAYARAGSFALKAAAGLWEGLRARFG